MTTVLDIENLVKTYRRRGRGPVRALRGVTLRVEAGVFALLQGPSGCGKTTLLLAAGGLLAPDTGGVRVNGREVYALDPEARARFRAEHIGYVFQQFHLIPYLNVIENVLTPCLAREHGDARARADRLIETFGLADRRTHVVSELSTGERQRVAMARALLNEPGLLLADEPTGNLDEESAAVVLDHLRTFARAGGAVLMATHHTDIPADIRFRMRAGARAGTDATGEGAEA